jgi:hypothetical protein
MANAIHNLETKWFTNDSGEHPALVMGLNLLDPDGLEAFLAEVLQKVTCQLMCSPPGTAHMTITIAGQVTAARFCEVWRRLSAGDPVLAHFMRQMRLADVLHIRGRELLDRQSLLDQGTP